MNNKKNKLFDLFDYSKVITNNQNISESIEKHYEIISRFIFKNFKLHLPNNILINNKNYVYII